MKNKYKFSHVRFNEEESYELFFERKYDGHRIHKNKKKYDRNEYKKNDRKWK